MAPVPRPRRAPLLLLLAILVAGCAADPYAREPDQVAADEWTLEPDSFYLPSFSSAKPSHVRAHVTVLAGDAIDVFLAAGAACDAYPFDGFQYAAMLNATVQGTLEADLPAGRACLALDNHDFPPGTSPGNGTVRVGYRIEVWET